MTRRATKSWDWFRTALVVIGTALPFCVPAKVDARCGCHLRLLYEHIAARPVVTRDISNASPIPWRSLHFVTNLRAQTWTSRLVRDLEDVWNSISMQTSVALRPCGQCPPNPASPGEPCRGPDCSGGAPPIAVPVSTSIGRTHESASFPGLCLVLPNNDSARCAEVESGVQPASLVDAIFHPPRSV
jgi:hypothetical protein